MGVTFLRKMSTDSPSHSDAEESKCWIDQFNLFTRTTEKFTEVWTEGTLVGSRLLTPLVPVVLTVYAFWLFYEYTHNFNTDTQIEMSSSGYHPLGTLAIGVAADFAVVVSAVGAATEAANPALPKTLSSSADSVSLNMCIGSETYLQLDPAYSFSPLTASQVVLAPTQGNTATSSVSITDGSYQYIAIANEVVKMNLATGEASTSALQGSAQGAIYNAGYGYFKIPGLYAQNSRSPHSLAQIDLSSMTQVASLQFPTWTYTRSSGYGSMTVDDVRGAAATDGTFGYFGFNARIYKVHLATMVIETYLQLEYNICVRCYDGYQVATAGAVSVDKQYGYFSVGISDPLELEVLLGWAPTDQIYYGDQTTRSLIKVQLSS